MRKYLVKIITLILIALSAIAFVGCVAANGDTGGDGDGSGGGNGIVKQYNDNITYSLSYTSDDECPNGNIVNDKLHASMDFVVGKVYYMVVDFTISSFEADGWDDSFSASIKISPLLLPRAWRLSRSTGIF